MDGGDSNLVEVRRMDLADPLHAEVLVELLDHYASGQSGGGTGLAGEVKHCLPGRLATWPGFVGFIAWHGMQAVGLINCFTGFSTFKGRPLLNIHDVVVMNAFRGQGIARRLFAAAEDAARGAGCCKVTLEVLSGNHVAKAVYESLGFRPYQLDPAMGTAQYYEKLL